MTCYGRRDRHQLAGKAKGQLFTNRMKYLIRALLTLIAIVLGLPALLIVLFVGFVLISDFPFTEREIVATAITNNGTELYVAQRSDGPYMSYSHYFYAKQPGSKWRQYVLDNEELRWRNVRIVVDEGTQKAVVYRGGDWVGEVNLRTKYMDIERAHWSSSGDEITPDSWSIDKFLSN